MQAAGAHGFHLRSVGRDLEVHGALAGALRQVVQEGLELAGVERGVFHRRVGEDDGGGVAQLGRVGRRIGHHVAVGVAIGLVQRAAEGAGGLGGGGSGGTTLQMPKGAAAGSILRR